MKPARISRLLHKWIALFVGIQALIWSVSGFYMVVVNSDFIRGDSLVRNLVTSPPRARPWHSLGDLRSRYEGITQIRIKGLPGFDGPLYELKTAGGLVLLDGVSGKQLSPLPGEVIRGLAQHYYAGSGQLQRLTLVVDNPPSELQTRALPLWRADFDDRYDATLYLHPDTGELVTRRHRFWRWYDFLWMLHIMDYESRENVNNGVLRVAAIAGVALAASGLWLLVFSFRRRERPCR